MRWLLLQTRVWKAIARQWPSCYQQGYNSQPEPLPCRGSFTNVATKGLVLLEQGL